MAIEIAAAIIVLGYVYQEFNYDSGYKNSDKIFRILTQNNKNELSGAATYGPLAQSLKSDFPDINDATRISFTGDIWPSQLEIKNLTKPVLFLPTPIFLHCFLSHL